MAADTPTTEDVRHAYGWSGEGIDFMSVEDEQRAAFDRWLAAEIARAKREEEKRIASEVAGMATAETVADWLCENTVLPESVCDDAAREIARMLAVPYE